MAHFAIVAIVQKSDLLKAIAVKLNQPKCKLLLEVVHKVADSSRSTNLFYFLENKAGLMRTDALQVARCTRT